MKKNKLILVVVIFALVACFFIFDLGQYLNLAYLKQQQTSINAYYTANPWQSVLIYFLAYIIITGLSLPGATAMTLIGGAIFGLLIGTIIISFASSIGATIAFLVSRFILRDYVQNKFGEHLETINQGVEKEGAFYLFALRLVPLFPFFVINLAMGLTPIRTLTYYLVSQVGMLAGTIVYVNAGTQIAQIDSLSGILSPTLILSFVLLGLFPLIAKKVLNYIQFRRRLDND